MDRYYMHFFWKPICFLAHRKRNQRCWAYTYEHQWLGVKEPNP